MQIIASDFFFLRSDLDLVWFVFFYLPRNRENCLIVKGFLIF